MIFPVEQKEARERLTEDDLSVCSSTSKAIQKHKPRGDERERRRIYMRKQISESVVAVHASEFSLTRTTYTRVSGRL